MPRKKPAGKAKLSHIPRTARAAARAGHKRVSFDFNAASATEKKKWLTFGLNGVEHGDPGRVRTGPAPGGGTIVCYYDENTGEYDICYIVK